MNASNDYNLTIIQTLTVDGEVSHISVSQNNTYLAVSTRGEKVYIFKRTNEYFLHQNITYSGEKTFREAVLTRDHQYMSVAGGNDTKAYFYKFNGDNEQFEPYLEREFEEYVDFVTISEDKKWVAVSEGDHAHVLSGLESGQLELEQSIYSADQWVNKFSKDSKFLILAKHGEAMIFRLCEAKENFVYNYEHKYCQYCQEGVEDGVCIKETNNKVSSKSLTQPSTSSISSLSTFEIVFLMLAIVFFFTIVFLCWKNRKLKEKETR